LVYPINDCGRPVVQKDFCTGVSVYQIMDTWRFIDTGYNRAAYNMAVDEAIAAAVRTHDAPPTLRLYGWNVPSVSIGYFQNIRDINLDYCREKHIPVVRRISGGRAVLHTASEITYSFSIRTDQGIFSNGLLESYRRISSALSLALTNIGLLPEIKNVRGNNNSPNVYEMYRSPVCFQSASFGEIHISGHKVIGSAQKRWTDCLLQHGAVPLIIDREALVNIFRLKQNNEYLYQGLHGINPGLKPDEIKHAFRNAFQEVFAVCFTDSSLLCHELSAAEEFENTKYTSSSWTFRIQAGG
jgi:lipoate-protein ligase A